MKKSINELAFFGGSPLFDILLPVGQINIPEYERFEALMNDVFDRKYYTNQGKLTFEFEDKFSELSGMKNSIAVTNGTVAISIAAKALNLPVKSKVIVPSFTFIGTVQALTWAGLEPVFADIDLETHTITYETVAPLLKNKNISAVLGVHLWGNPCDVERLDEIEQQYGIPVFYDAAHAVGSAYKNKSLASFGHCSTFSLHATKVLQAAEGGVICTDDDELAERIRNMRSSYGRRRQVSVPLVINGRFSELQAAMALLSIEKFSEYVTNNKHRYLLYKEKLKNIAGLSAIEYDESMQGNYQYVVFRLNEEQFGLSRDLLVEILSRENIIARKYFIPAAHKSVPYINMECAKVKLPNTELLIQEVFQLPSGQIVTDEHIEQICELISFIQQNAEGIKKNVERERQCSQK